MWYANILAGLAMFLLGVGTAVLSWTTLPYSGEFGPGPGFLPLWLGVGLAASSVPVILNDLRNRSRSEKLFRPETINCVKILILVVIVFLAVPITGFSIGLALITAGGMRIIGQRSWRSCLLTVVATAICIHYLFGQLLTIPIPGGILDW